MAGVMWIRLVELAVKFWLPKMMLHPRARSPVPLVKKPRGWAPFFFVLLLATAIQCQLAMEAIHGRGCHGTLVYIWGHLYNHI